MFIFNQNWVIRTTILGRDYIGDLESGAIVDINNTTHTIVNIIREKPVSMDELLEKLSAIYKVDVNVIRSDVKRVTDNLQDFGVLSKYPFFSIVIPAYRIESYIAACLDSIIQQSFTDYEIIVIDDGSDDNSADIANEYSRKDSRITVLSQNNRGLSASRNVGMATSKGDYLLFVDGDDRLLPGILERLYQNLRDIQPDILYYNGVKGNRYEKVRKIDVVNDYLMTGEVWMTSNINHGEWIPVVWLGCYNRSFLESHEAFFEDGMIHEDELFTLKCLKYAERIRYIDIPGYFYNIRGTSIMRMKKPLQDFLAYAKCCCECAELYLSNESYNTNASEWLCRRYLLSAVKYLYNLDPEQRIKQLPIISELRLKSAPVSTSEINRLLDIEELSNEHGEEAYSLWLNHVREVRT